MAKNVAFTSGYVTFAVGFSQFSYYLCSVFLTNKK